MPVRARKEDFQSTEGNQSLRIRFRIYHPSHPEAGSPYFPAQLIHLSDQGLSMLTNTTRSNGVHILGPHVFKSEQCHVEVEISGGEKPVTVCGKTVSYDLNFTPHPFRFRVTIQFADLHSDLRNAIRSLINGCFAAKSFHGL